MDFHYKYLKYKQKYLKLRNMSGGISSKIKPKFKVGDYVIYQGVKYEVISMDPGTRNWWYNLRDPVTNRYTRAIEISLKKWKPPSEKTS